MTSFLDSIKEATNVKRTEKGAITNKSSKDSLLDFFGQGGAMRNRDEFAIYNLFSKAYTEDPNLAMKMLFYFRDIRGGQGERRLFKVILKNLAINHPESVRKNLTLIPEYGRWDDLYSVFDTTLEKDAIKIMKNQLSKDWKSENPSLCAKWMKSENASSKETIRLAKKTIKGFGWSPKKYRLVLSELRSRIDIVETKISNKNYDAIDYSKVPSKASMQYRNAFYRNDELAYTRYLDKLTSGDKSVKVNADTLYPYEIAEKILYTGYANNEVKLFNAMWDALPDYIENKDDNSIVVADTSGSMTGRPMAVSVSLALYLAQKNSGPFKNHFITFSSSPEMVEIKGNNICDILRNMSRANWSQSTNLEAVFDLILNGAINGDFTQEDMPNKLYIVSDMEFDAAARDGKSNYYSWSGESIDRTSLFNKMKKRYRDHGYELPQIVYWNVDARNNNMPITIDDDGCQIVSGCSPSIFKNTMSGTALTAYDLMLDVITQERYAPIKA